MAQALARSGDSDVVYNELWMDRGLIFPTTVWTPAARQNLARRSFKPLIRAAKVPNRRFHDMRHTFATLM